MEGNREPGPRGVVEKPHSCHDVKGLPALVESSSRRLFAEFTLSAEILRLRLRMTAGSEGLRMTEGGFLNSPLPSVVSVRSTVQCRIRRGHPDCEIDCHEGTKPSETELGCSATIGFVSFVASISAPGDNGGTTERLTSKIALLDS